MENKIKHVGIVQAIENGRVIVRIVQSSACATCKAAQQCNAAESKAKTVFVYTDNAEYFVGQDVVVTASYDDGVVYYDNIRMYRIVFCINMYWNTNTILYFALPF